ncbi:hypothetical protein ABT063_46645 [Streptomyces sp. NPDC002838]|uniref:hypothetical protein n=1 Tax=Streptomyces sp. NPDC002838 TaxID=3154436 RepID=UPI00332CC74A
MANDDPMPVPGPSEPSADGTLSQGPRPVWWRRRPAWIAGVGVLTGIVIVLTVLVTRPDGYDNTPEGAAQRLIDVMGDPQATYHDLYANACADERRAHDGPDRPLRYPGAIHLVLDKVTQPSETRAVATTHIKEIPDNSIELLLVKEDGIWKDCGSP